MYITRRTAVTKKKKLPAFRKMAIGTWQNAYDPQVTADERFWRRRCATWRFRTATGKKFPIT
jgi:hypothetical protein